MTENKLTPQSEFLDQIRLIYENAFPPEERLPFHLLVKFCDAPGWDFTYYTEEGQLLGFLLVICNKTHAYLIFFAVNSQLRGKGYGTRIVESMKEKYKEKTIFLSIEELDETAPNALLRQKRHAFYLRLGLRDMKMKIKMQGIPYTVLGIGEEVTPEDFNDILRLISTPFVSYAYHAYYPEA